MKRNITLIEEIEIRKKNQIQNNEECFLYFDETSTSIFNKYKNATQLIVPYDFCVVLFIWKVMSTYKKATRSAILITAKRVHLICYLIVSVFVYVDRY